MRLRLTLKAARQVEKALDHIAIESPQGAANVRRRLLDILDVIVLYPRIGHPTDRPGLRRVNLTPYPYFLDYRLSDDEIIVLRFRHGARRR